MLKSVTVPEIIEEIAQNHINTGSRKINKKIKYRFYVFYFIFRYISMQSEDGIVYIPHKVRNLYGKCSKKVHKILGESWYLKYFIDILLKENVIYLKKNYGADIGRCKGYLLAEEFKTCYHKSIGIKRSKDRGFYDRLEVRGGLTKIAKQTTEHIKRNFYIKSDDALMELVENEFPDLIGDCYLSIQDRNFNRLHSLMNQKIDEKYGIKRLRFDIEYVGLKRFDKQTKKEIQSKRHRVSRIINICQGNEFMHNRCKQDKFGNRLHTEFTSMPKVFRKFICTTSGEELVEIDISNSQPHIIGQSLKIRGLKVDLKFLEDTKTGVIYDKIQKLMGYSYDRDQTKKQLFMCVFFTKDTKTRKYSKIGKAFRKLYPKTFKTFQKITKKDGKELCRMAQRLESAIFIEDVYKKLLEEGIPCLTIHDSCIVPKQYVRLVRCMIKQSYCFKGLDIPSMKTKPLISDEDKQRLEYDHSYQCA